MTSPSLPLLSVARLPTTPATSHTRREVVRRLQSPRSGVFDSKLVAISRLSGLLTYTSIRLDADGTSRRPIWHLPVHLSSWEYSGSTQLIVSSVDRQPPCSFARSKGSIQRGGQNEAASVCIDESDESEPGSFGSSSRLAATDYILTRYPLR